MRYVIILFCVLLFSCKAEWHAKRANHHWKKALEKGIEAKTDTVIVRDTIVTETVRVDTTTRILPGDTVEIIKEKLKLKLIRTKPDTFLIEAECKGDTVYVEKKVPVVREVSVSEGIKWWWLIVAAAAGMLLAWLKR